MTIGRFTLFAFDCPDPFALATFYAGITGWEVDGEGPDEWIELVAEGGGATLAFQRVEGYAPPSWPGQAHPQQAHPDFDVADLDRGEEQVLALGATKSEYQPGTTFRVFLDPAGHPFCLVLEH
jgi:catechol 2,3-dioxygenase-like lactoylglutathione lyase family enzyme